MTFGIYATFEQMHGRRSTVPEIVALLRQFSRESVLYVCSVTGSILELWQRGAWKKENYDVAIDSAFEFIRGDWYKSAARMNEPELVFHRRQLLFLMKLAIEHCAETGVDLLKIRPGVFGTILLMANDHFHYELYPFAGSDKADEFERVSRVFAEFVPVNEYSGFRVENKLTRAHLMMTRYPNELRAHPDYIDIASVYEEVTGISLLDYEALSFGLFTRCTQMTTLEALRANAWVAAIRPTNFHLTAIPSQTIQAFFSECADTPQGFAITINASRSAGRDFGPNDFTVFRRKPLITEAYGSLPSDAMLVAEKFESGPYWRVNDIDKATGDKLRRFWGAVFEIYLNALMIATLGATYIPDPRLMSDPNVQICDALLVEGDNLVVLEYKSSMFSARAKYSGNHVLLRNELETKLVRDSAEKKKKGVEQLGEAVRILSDVTRNTVKGLDLAGIKRVYPLLVTLDDVGSSLLITRMLNMYFNDVVKRDGQTVRDSQTADIRPLFCTDVESLEMVLPFVDVLPLTGFLEHWVQTDENLMATLLARPPDGLPKRRNEFLDREWKALYEQIASRLFPTEFSGQNPNLPVLNGKR